MGHLWSLPLPGDLVAAIKPRAKKEERAQGWQRRAHKHTLATGLGPAPGSLGSAVDGGVPQQGIALGTGVQHHGARAVPGPGAGTVLPVGNARGGRTPHLCQRQGKACEK